ncbi:MAG: metal ABC transporter permease [Stomatobaculum sp.]
MLNTEILTGYSFGIVALGTFLLSAAAGAVGCVTVLKGQSLIGDAIGHSAFPGVVLAFMLFLQRDPAVLILGAIVSGTVAFALIQLIDANARLDLDAILAVVLSSFFGLGMVLKSHIQGNPDYAGASQSGLKNYIFGQAAYIMLEDVRLLLLVAALSLLLLTVFYKEIKLFLFDEVYARTIGLRTTLLYGIILFMTMSLIAAGLKLVGAILISSLLIVPAITAMQWSDKFHIVLITAGLTGGASALIGTYISTVSNGMSTGAVIILVMSVFALLSLVLGPHGVIANLRMRRREKKSHA